jgi:hypothetical protein
MPGRWLRTLLLVPLLGSALVGAVLFVIATDTFVAAQARGVAAIGLSFALLGLGLAYLLMRSQPAGVGIGLRMPGAGYWVLAIVIGLAGGTATQELVRVRYFAPFYLLAFAGWGGLLISLIDRWLPGLELGDAVAALAHGGFFATLISLPLELAAFLGAGGLSLLGAMVAPGGEKWIEALLGYWGQAEQFVDMETQLALVSNPLVVATVGLTAVVAAPLIEEFLKGLGALRSATAVGDTNRYLARGMLSGIGFGIVESLVNAAMLGSAWSVGAVVRFLAVSMHCLTGGVMGVAFLRAKERKWLQAVATAALAVGIHALWNGSTLMLGLATLRGAAGLEGVLP